MPLWGMIWGAATVSASSYPKWRRRRSRMWLAFTADQGATMIFDRQREVKNAPDQGELRRLAGA
jgi:hypothetical protein